MATPTEVYKDVKRTKKIDFWPLRYAGVVRKDRITIYLGKPRVYVVQGAGLKKW
jgi:hypothetical protein